MAYYITKRVYVDGLARFTTHEFNTLSNCVDCANLDNADCLIGASNSGIINYRIEGRWKE